MEEEGESVELSDNFSFMEGGRKNKIKRKPESSITFKANSINFFNSDKEDIYEKPFLVSDNCTTSQNPYILPE